MGNLFYKTPGVEAGFSKLNPGLQKALGGLSMPATITSTYRGPGENKAVGGVPNSYHTSGDAVDIRTRDKTPEELSGYKNYFASQGYKVIDEGDHLHIQPGSGGTHSHVETAPQKPSWFQSPAARMAQNYQPAAPASAPSYSGFDFDMGAEEPMVASQPAIGPGPRKKKSFLAGLGDMLGDQIPLFGALKVLFQKKDKPADLATGNSKSNQSQKMFGGG